MKSIAALNDRINLFNLIVFICLVLQAFYVTASENKISSFVNGEKEYVIDKGKYSIKIPNGWEVTQGDMGTDLIAVAPLIDPADLFRENLNIISAKLDTPITKEQYYEYNIKSLENFLNDFDLEKIEDVKVGGLEAKRVTFSHTMGVVNAEVVQYLILKGQNAYALTCTSDRIHFREIFPVFEKIVGTFRFIN